MTAHRKMVFGGESHVGELCRSQRRNRLTISALRDIGLRHGLEMHTGLIGTGRHGRSLAGRGLMDVV